MKWREFGEDYVMTSFLPSMIRMMKSRRKRLARHVARISDKKNAYRLSLGKPEG
jgi:hypothetical protein